MICSLGVTGLQKTSSTDGTCLELKDDAGILGLRTEVREVSGREATLNSYRDTDNAILSEAAMPGPMNYLKIQISGL
jgi:hypothetical protein